MGCSLIWDALDTVDEDSSGAMAQGLRAHATLADDLGLVCGTHMVVHNFTPIPKDSAQSSDLCGHQVNTWCTYIYARKALTHIK